MKVLVTGAGGMLAAALVPELQRAGHLVIPTSRADLDVADGVAVRSVVGAVRPDVVIQCAAYTAVDRAEAEEGEAHRVNAGSVAALVEACDAFGARLVYPSTDYVFRGTARSPYRPDDETDPVNAYGRSKLAGEEKALERQDSLVVRTSWLYGPGGSSFVETMLGLAAAGGPLKVVDDQWGRPTCTLSLALTLRELMESGARGIFHATDGGDPVSWHGFAREILRQVGSEAEVQPTASGAFPRPAARPSYSVLDCSSTEREIGRPMRPWRDALTEYLGMRSGGTAGVAREGKG